MSKPVRMTARQQWAQFRANWPVAPPGLKIISVVCLAATLLYLPELFAPLAVREYLIQYLGWSPIMQLFAPALIAASAIASPRPVGPRVLVYLGLLNALSATWHAYRLGQGSQFPYFKVSPWLLAWELGLAVALVVVGTSARVHKYCEQRQP